MNGLKVFNDCKKSGLIGCRNRDRAKFMALSMCILLIICALCYLTGEMSGILAGGGLNVAFLGAIVGNCEEKIAHTGRDNCPRQQGKIVGVLLSKLSATYPADATVFNENIQQYIVSNGVDKIWPVMNILENAVTGGDPATSDVGFGGPTPIGLNAYQVDIVIEGGDCLYKELMNLDKLQMRAQLVDENSYRFGTEILQKTGGTPTVLDRGFEVKIKIYRTAANGSDPYKLHMVLYFSANYEKELANMFAAPIDELPAGLVSVRLKGGTAAGIGYVVSACSGSDYTSDFGNLWAKEMFVTEAGANPTGLNYDSEANTLTFTPSGSYRIRNAFALDAGGIFGLDGENTFTTIN